MSDKTNNVSTAIIIAGILISVILLLPFDKLDIVHVGNENLNVNVSSEIITLDEYNSAIHLGNAYFVKNWTDLTGAETVVNFVFYTDDVYAHATWDLSGEAEFIFDLYEGAIITNNGTKIIAQNHNREFTNNNSVVAYANPTISDDGTLVYSSVVGSGKDAFLSRSIGGEFIGNKSTWYLFRITKVATGTHWLDYEFNWAEEI